MQLADLYVSITLDAGDFEEKIGKYTEKGRNLGESLSGSISKVGKTLAGAAIFGKAAQGLANLTKMGMSYNAQMEEYETNFRVMLGSQEAAVAKVEELRQMAAKTPFSMEDLASGTQTLLSFGIEAEKTQQILRMLGDVSLGDKNKLSSLTLAFAQISSAGKLSGQDLLQMINAGFNPLQSIAEKTGASIGDLKEAMAGKKGSDQFQKQIKDAQKEVAALGNNASDGAKMLAKIGEDGYISSELVTEAFEIATSEGGKFYNGMEEASKTFSGQLSTLKDDVSALIGNAFEPAFSWLSANALPYAQDAVSQLSQGFEEGGISGMLSAAGNIIGDLGEKLRLKAEEILPGVANGVIDVLNSTFGLNIPHIDSIKLPSWEDIKNTVSGWWNGGDGGVGGISGLISGMTEWALGKLSAFPDLKTIVDSVSSWWTVKVLPEIEHLFSWALVGDPNMPPLEATVTAIENWSKDLWRVIEQLFKWSFGIDLPSYEEVAYDIKTWWESVKRIVGDLFIPANVPTGIHTTQFGTFGGGGGTFAPGHATGLDYVPYDNYLSRLHEGEAVLTKAEADNWRRGDGMQPPAAIDYDRLGASIANALAGMHVQLDGRTVGELLTPVVSQNIERDMWAGRYGG